MKKIAPPTGAAGRWDYRALLYKLVKLARIACAPRRHQKLRKVLSGEKFSRAGLSTFFPHIPFLYLGDQYLAQGISVADKAKIALHHYNVLHACFSHEFMRDFLLQEIVLWRAAREDNAYEISLSLSREIREEGDATLRFSMNGSPVYFIGFSFAPGGFLPGPNRHALLVSRMQGVLEGAEQFHRASKDFLDVTPQFLLFSALRGVAEALDIRHVLGVSSDRQVCRRQSNQFRLESTYDKFWENIGGSAAGGFFNVDFEDMEKPIGCIKQKHRSRTLAKRRVKSQVGREVFETMRGCREPVLP